MRRIVEPDVDRGELRELSERAVHAPRRACLYLLDCGVDIQLLGVGRNGHIGFNEPADHFTEGSFKVKLNDSTIEANSIYFDENPMPRYALTMGIGTIMKAGKIVLIATGKKKAEAIRNAIKGEVTPHCPVSVLQNHPDALLLLDREAASLL